MRPGTFERFLVSAGWWHAAVAVVAYGTVWTETMGSS